MAAREDAQVVSLAVALGVSNTLGVFNSFTPNLTELRRADPNDLSLAADLRHGEVATLAVAGGVAVAGSVIIDNWLPLLVSMVLLSGLVALSEYTLHHRPLEPVPTPREDAS